MNLKTVNSKCLKIKQHYFLKMKQKLIGKIIPSSVQNMYMLKILHLYTKNCYRLRFEKNKRIAFPLRDKCRRA